MTGYPFHRTKYSFIIFLPRLPFLHRRISQSRNMVLQLQGHHLLGLPLLPIDLQHSISLIKKCETQDEFSNSPVMRVCMLAVQFVAQF